LGRAFCVPSGVEGRASFLLQPRPCALRCGGHSERSPDSVGAKRRISPRTIPDAVIPRADAFDRPEESSFPPCSAVRAPAVAGCAPCRGRHSGCWGQGYPLYASWTSSQFLWVAPMSYSYVYGISTPEVQP